MKSYFFISLISRVVLSALLMELAFFPHAGQAANAERTEPSASISGSQALCMKAPQYEGEWQVQSLPETKMKSAKRVSRVLITAYSSTPDQTDDSPFITANGTRVRDGIIAANFLRFNTQVRIPEIYGDKIFIVTDRMHPRFSDRVDIWMETREEARQFGVKRATIEVY